jgi:DNA-binding Xre family transcriptional regulator
MVINTVKKFLESRNITAYRLCKDTGIVETTAYALIKRPEQLPGPEVVRKICDRYQVQPGELMEWVNERS